MSSFQRTFLLSIFFTLLLSCCCDDDIPCTDCDDTPIEGPYDPQEFVLDIPTYLPSPTISADNPLTVGGIQLGRMLFYDPILSSDSTMSCSSCHKQELAFTDGLAKSLGVLGLESKRSSMALINLGMNTEGFFWDGRSATLEEQAILPVEAHDELNEDWSNVEQKLRNHSDYPAAFRAAFGIELRSEITRELAAKALTQFQMTMISGDSKYDQVVWRNEEEFTPLEELGYELFLVETSQILGHPGCTHCHGEPLLTDNNFRNNGLDDVDDLANFADIGHGGFTGIIFDNGKFRTPTLRNIALTGPYMHDGRFETLEEVLAHYAGGGHNVENEDVNIRPFELTEQEQDALVAFLHTLTDTSFINNPAFSNPF